MSILQPYEVLQPSIQCPFVSLGGSCLLISPIIGISQSLCFYANLSERWVSHFKSLFFNSHITHLCIFANSSHSGKSGQALFSVMVTDSPIWVTKCSLKHGIFAMSLGSRSSPRVYPLPFVFTCQLQWCTGGNHKIASDNGLLNIQKFCNPVVKPLVAWKLGFLDGSDSKKNCLQCRRPGFDPWVLKIPWRRDGLPTSVSLPGEFHGQRSLVGYCPWGHKESDTTEPVAHTQLES